MKVIAAIVVIVFFMSSYPNVDRRVDAHMNPLRARHPPVYGKQQHVPHDLTGVETRPGYERTPRLYPAVDNHLLKPPPDGAFQAGQKLNYVTESGAQDAETSPDPSPDPSGRGVVFAFTLAEEGEIDLNIQLTFRKLTAQTSTAMIDPTSTVGPDASLMTSLTAPYYAPRGSRIEASPPSRPVLRQTEVRPTARGWSNRGS